MEKINCQVCGREVTHNNLCQHVKRKHGLTNYEYGVKFNYRIEGEGEVFRVDDLNGIIYLRENRKTYSCPICGHKLTPNSSYIESHVKRVHGITNYLRFYRKYYQLDNPDDVKEFFRKGTYCGLCEKRKIDINSLIEADHNNKTFRINTEKGYNCNTEECREETSQRILGEPYNSKSYEHIGSRIEFLNDLYKLGWDWLKLKALKHGDELNRNNVDLNGFIQKYGEEEGARLYDEMRKKQSYNKTLNGLIDKYGKEKGNQLYNEMKERLSYSKTLESYVNKYGEEEGKKKYNQVRENIVTGDKTQSKLSKQLGKLLKECNIEFKEEYYYRGDSFRRTDFYLINDNLHIEFFGDYWHCNPALYSKDYYNEVLGMAAKEKWKFDKNRLKDIIENTGCNVLVIWERTWKRNKRKVLNVINAVRNMNSDQEIMYI